MPIRTGNVLQTVFSERQGILPIEFYCLLGTAGFWIKRSLHIVRQSQRQAVDCTQASSL